MKKLLLYLPLLFLIVSCTKDFDDYAPIQETPNASRELLMLRVDFETNQFKGGKLFHFEGVPMTPTIPLTETYLPPSDFGNYKLAFTPTGEVIFNGPVTWMGTSSEIATPDYSAPETYPVLPTNSAADLATAQYFTPTADIIASEGYTSFNYETIWNAVSNLEIVHQFTAENAKVGFMLYTPGLGVFQPQHADWFIILYK